MPIYEYGCEKCGEQFSRLRPMRESDARAECPNCGHAEVERVLSNFAAVTRGSEGSCRIESLGGQNCASTGMG